LCQTRKNEHHTSKFRAPGGIVAGIGVLALLAFCYLLGMLDTGANQHPRLGLRDYLLCRGAADLQRAAAVATTREGS
jgi:hypothetical protein